jgi:predicted amidophosphoribosyltransferase
MTAQSDAWVKPGGTEELICPKCQHPNPAEAVICTGCQKQLYIFCGHCGEPNFRGNTRCSKCDVQLHQSRYERWRMAKARKWVKYAQVILLVVAVFLTYKVIVKVAEFDAPKPRLEDAHIPARSQ